MLKLKNSSANVKKYTTIKDVRLVLIESGILVDDFGFQEINFFFYLYSIN